MVSPRSLLRTAFVVLGATAVVALPSYFPHVAVSQDHYEVLGMRASTEVNPSALLEVECLDRRRNVVFHDQNVAELAICGGIAGAVQRCQGAPRSTVGHSGSAKFTINPVDQGASINISKWRWEQCVRAARAVCPTGSLRAMCSGGSTMGDIRFTLDNP